MTKTKLIEDLRGVGLPEKSALIYAYILETGVAFPSKIAVATKLNRSTVYNILNDLKTKGLVTEIERGKKLCYQIENPVRLPGIIKQQIHTAEERYKKAKNLLPELQGLFSLVPNKPRIRYFEGLNGVLAIYQEHVNALEPYEMLSYSNVEELMKRLPKAFVAKYIKQKEKIGITTRAIFPETPFTRNYNASFYRNVSKQMFVRSKFIPAQSFPFGADVTIFDKNKVSIINFSKNILVGLVIEDETIAGIMRMGFELAWKGVG